MRLVDIIFNARDADENAVFLKAFIGELYIPAELDAPADVLPIFLCPNAVKVSRERELCLLVVKDFSRLDGTCPMKPLTLWRCRRYKRQATYT